MQGHALQRAFEAGARVGGHLAQVGVQVGVGAAALRAVRAVGLEARQLQQQLGHVPRALTGHRGGLGGEAGQVVVGPRLPVTDLMALDTVAARLHDGSHHTLGQGVGADADGHPLDAVARLARELAAFGQRLEAGDLVITGGLTKACVLEAGGRLVGVFSCAEAWTVDVAVRRR